MRSCGVLVDIHWLAGAPASLAEPKLGCSAGSITRHEGDGSLRRTDDFGGSVAGIEPRFASFDVGEM